MNKQLSETEIERIRREIVAALAHVEAEDGLYFENLVTLHEDEERPPVVGDELSILEVLKDLIRERRVRVDDSGEKPIFSLLHD